MTPRPPLDPQTTDRLVSGRLAPDDAPPGYRRTAQLFSDAQPAARQPVPPAQLDAMVDVILTTADPSGRPASPRKPMLTQLLTAKALAVVGVLTLGVTAAGAATGSLPNAAQGAAHDTLAHIGVNLPDPDDATNPAVAHNEGDNSQPSDAPVADVSGDNQGDNNDQNNGAVADVSGDNQGDDNQNDGPVTGISGDNQGDTNDDNTPVADTPGDNQGDNNDQGETPAADVPDDHHDDNNQGEAPETSQPDDNQQGDSSGDGGN
jgi:hypothetical protein